MDKKDGLEELGDTTAKRRLSVFLEQFTRIYVKGWLTNLKEIFFLENFSV